MENSDIKPSTIMLIVGGAVLAISTFLDWVSIEVDTGFGSVSFSENAWNTDGFGLLGIFCAVIGLVIAGGVGASQFGNVSMPDRILGFSFRVAYHLQCRRYGRGFLMDVDMQQGFFNQERRKLVILQINRLGLAFFHSALALHFREGNFKPFRSK